MEEATELDNYLPLAFNSPKEQEKETLTVLE